MENGLSEVQASIPINWAAIAVQWSHPAPFFYFPFIGELGSNVSFT
jgi:hypothetical protein